MHRAPAVNFSVKRARWHARFVVFVTLLSCLAYAALVGGHRLFDGYAVLLLATILLTSGAAFIGWKQSSTGILRWDGQHWFWSCYPGNPVCRLRLLMDFQRVVLVSIETDAHIKAYLWLESVSDTSNWARLRRAIVSSQAGAEDEIIKTETPVAGDPA